jgi:hypothetical protein
MTSSLVFPIEEAQDHEENKGKRSQSGTDNGTGWWMFLFIAGLEEKRVEAQPSVLVSDEEGVRAGWKIP